MSATSDCRTLATALERAASLRSRGVTAVRLGGREERCTYDELRAAALGLLGDLQERGLGPGRHVVLQIGETREFLRAFWACIVGGLVPVPLAESRGPEPLLKFARVWAQLARPHLLTTRAGLEAARIAAHAAGAAELPDDCVTLVDASKGSRAGRPAEIHADDVAFVQFSSGSTGQPKGVVLTHRNLLTNIRAMRRRTRTDASDETVLSWMPLTHDMGLIGFHLTPVVAAWDHVLMPPELFQRNPLAWLELATAHRATVTGSPNQGLRHTLKHALAGAPRLDLSSLRLLLNGAEPISHDVCGAFVRALEPHGLRPDVMLPVYGLAEASLAVTFPDPGEPLLCVSADRSRLSEGDRVIAVFDGDPRARTFVAVGRPVDDCGVRIALESGAAVEDGVVGRIQIRGESVASRFYGSDAGASRAPDEWLDTGDLGFFHDGRLVVTGRRKEILFLNGQNVYPADVERVAARAAGTTDDRVAVAAVAGRAGGEAAAFVTHRGSLADFGPIARAVRRAVGTHLGLPLAHVVPVPRIPRTTSGKPQRIRLGEELEAGVYAAVLAELAQLEGGSAPRHEADAATARVLAIWRDVLGQAALGPVDHFFERGGDSLAAARAAHLAGRAFGRTIGARLVFEQPTAAGFAAAMHACPPLAPAIARAEVRDVYGLSPEQRTLVLLQKANPDSTVYNVPFAVRLRGLLDPQRLERAIEQVLLRHDALRTRFVMAGADLVQRVERNAALCLAVETVVPDRLDDALVAFVRPFDLERAPLLRAKLFQLGEDECVLAFDVHHAVADGSSALVIVREVAAFYNGAGPVAPARSVHDYLAERRLAEDARARDEEHWLRTYADGIPPLDLPSAMPRSATRRFAGSRVRFALGREEVAAVRNVAARCRSTVFAVLLSAYYVLLARLARARDIAVASVSAARPDEDAWRVVGMFAQTVLLRARVSESFDDLVRRVAWAAADGFSHAGVPIEEWAARLPLTSRRDGPLVEAMFVLQNMPLPALDFAGVPAARVDYPSATAKFDLCLEVWDEEHAFSCVLEYAADRLDEGSARRCVSWYRRLLARIAASPGIDLDALDLLDDAERRELVECFNDTAAPLSDETVLDLVERQARETPDAPATLAADSGGATSYAELDRWAAAIARRLLAAGAEPGEIVGVLLPRSAGLLASILATWKCGAAYLPLEPELPAERLAQYLADSGARFVIGAGEAASILAARTGAALLPADGDAADTVGPDAAGSRARDTALSARAPQASDLAYVLYTSGTTGAPKGVMVEHRSLANYVTWAVRAYHGGERANHAFHTSFAFDLTVTSMFAPLVSGGAVVLCPGDAAAALRQALSDPRVGAVKLTPSHLKLARALGIQTAPRRLVVGGENLETDLARELVGNCPGAEIYNEYGPTEATVGCMVHRFDPSRDTGAAVPIGVPAANCRIYVLDATRRPVPPLLPGEIYIGGHCLARGYLGDDALTDARFVPDPFVAGARIYATGDLARHGPNGVLEFLGRADEQVKIRGHRVSPEDVRSQLVKCPGVHEAFVTAERSPRGADELHAYLVIDAPVRLAAIRVFLAERLPTFMVPAVLRVAPELPLTASGKLDRARLAASSRPLEPVAVYEPPRTALEEQLADVWRTVLGTERVGRRDNFFDLGGDSIKAMLVATRADRLGMAMTMQDVLGAETLEALALRCQPRAAAAAVDAPERGVRPLLPMEAWFREQRFVAPERYLHAVLFSLRGRADLVRLRNALRAVVGHHDGLRQNYHADSGLMSCIADHIGMDATLDIVEIDDGRDARAVAADMAGTIAGAMDLERSLLFRAVLLRAAAADLLLVVAHHLVVDGVSWRVVAEDLAAAYAAEGQPAAALARKTAPLRAIAEALETYGRSPRARDQVPFWRDVGETAAPAPVTSGGPFERRRFSLDGETTQALIRGASAGYNADPATLLVVALLRVLRADTGAPAHHLEIEHHGRVIPGLVSLRTVGWLSSLYPVALHLPDVPVDGQIAAVKDQLRRVPDSGVGYGVLRHIVREPALAAPVRVAARLNYLGELALPNDGFIADAEALFLEPVTQAAPPACNLQIDALVRSGRLGVIVTGRGPVQPFVEAYAAELRRLTQHASAQDRTQFTPSDFDTVALDQRELDRMLT